MTNTKGAGRRDQQQLFPRGAKTGREGKSIRDMTLVDAMRETSRIGRRWYGKMMAHAAEQEAVAGADNLVQIDGNRWSQRVDGGR